MKKFLLSLFILFFILISFKQSQAGVLRLFLSGGAKQLGSGGFSLTNKLYSDLDLLHPTSLLKIKKGSLIFQYEFEDVIRAKGEKGAKSWTSKPSLIALIPAGSKRIFCLELNKGDSYLNTKDPHLKLNFESKLKVFSYAQKVGNLIIGLGIFEGKNKADGYSEYLEEKIDIFSKKPFIFFSNSKSSRFAEISYSFNRQKTWATFRLEKAKSRLKFIMDDGEESLSLPFKTEGNSYELKVRHKVNQKLSLTLLGNYGKQEGEDVFRFEDSIELGKGIESIYFKNLGLGVFYKKNKNTNLFANYNKEYNEVKSSGSISLSPFASPFFGLLGGRLVFKGKVKVRGEVYHLGMERRQNRFIYRFGMQYIPLKLEGYLTTAQRFLFGTVEKNKKTEYLPITKAEIKIISLGLGYKINESLKIDYGLGQIIPKFTKRRGPGMPEEKEELREATKGKVRGGTLHLLSLSYYF